MAIHRTMDEFLQENRNSYVHGIFRDYRSNLSVLRAMEGILRHGVVSNQLATRAKLSGVAPSKSSNVHFYEIEGANWQDIRSHLYVGADATHIILGPETKKRIVMQGRQHAQAKFRIPPRYIKAVVLPEQKTRFHSLLEHGYLSRLKRFGKPIYAHDGRLIWHPEEQEKQA